MPLAAAGAEDGGASAAAAVGEPGNGGEVAASSRVMGRRALGIAATARQQELTESRELGLAEATKGMIQGHVIRMVPPCTDEVRKRHYHHTQFQMTYIIRGWMKIEFEGLGEVTLKAGSLAMLPPRIKHTVLDYSEDCEQIELIMPADYETTSAE